MSSVSTRLALLFFAITAAAIGFVYLYVVPQLSSSLTAEKLGRLERAAVAERDRLAASGGPPGARERPAALARGIERRTGSRVTLLRLEAGALPPTAIADSRGAPALEAADAPPVETVADGGGVASAVTGGDGGRRGVTAVALPARGSARWVAVFSTGLEEVDDSVALIRRQILIAGTIALLAALGAGWLVARAHARRLRRLERAAEKVADGDFTTPIPVDSGDEVGQLAVSFNEMQRRLARLDDARREFIANASHELRTPISSLSGFVELLADEDPDPATRAEFLGTMREQVDRLAKLAADLLDLSRLDADAIEVRRERVPLGVLARRVAAEFEPAAGARGSPIEVAADEAVAAEADPDRVAQILRILIDNALTHTPGGTAISVGTRTSDGSASLLVSDDGPGIRDPRRERVFERFYTGDGTGGSGLGLAIGRELAERMDGSLELCDGERTRFELRLPPAVAPGR